ncbi:hypothetical protein [Asaia krungthepensis]|uniref:Lipoprotein n=1 Tax=Asaia krungthepensis NRIC 0535 TaxID=1307925 RepID=A0ABQ0Q5E5_9PROT|nr:hypothetical protein [Asaia krungthepensis]GBQ92242.1 hypothetical protein AA0535_2494 [Asaia krungthepensis NRIC 0535]
MKTLTHLLCLSLIASVMLTACGKKGAPHAPGPASKITYPHTYPPE